MMILKLARSGRSCQLSAISFQFSDGANQCCQHTLHLDNSARQSLVIRGLQNLQVVRQKEMVQAHWQSPSQFAESGHTRNHPSGTILLLSPIEADTLRIWLVKPYNSSFGKEQLAL